MKKFMRSKFSKEKVAKFFDKEGFYIVLFLCVCIVAITAVWVSRTAVKDGDNGNLTDVNDNKPAVTAPNQETTEPSMETDDKPVFTATEDDKSSKDQTQQQNDKKESSSTTTKTQTPAASVKFSSPIKDGLVAANIIKDYSQDDLVYYESLDEWRAHLGIDVKAAEGTEVLAVHNGKVVDIRNDNDLQNGLGWTVVVDHGNGYQSVYANLDEKIEVKKNQAVKKGDILGFVGRSAIFEKTVSDESDEYSHLHFEVLKKSGNSYEKVDPNNYLTLQK